MGLDKTRCKKCSMPASEHHSYYGSQHVFEPLEPSSKSEVCKCGKPEGHQWHDKASYVLGAKLPFHQFEPQPPVSAPEKCPRCGLTKEQCAKASASLDFEDDSAQPTPSEGPYHPAMDRLSVKFGPDEFQVKFSSPETVGTECILMNMGFAQGQASSAKEIDELTAQVEVYRKALEMISQHEDCLCKPGMEVVKEALLTSKPEPVAPVRKWEADGKE